MMKEKKTSFRLLRYCYGIKTNCIQAGVFLLTGVLLMALGDKNGELMGCYFWVTIGLLPAQLISSLSVSKMVQSSPMKKKIQTIIPVAVSLGCVLLIYLLESLVYGIRLLNGSGQEAEISGFLLAVAIMTALMLTYVGVALKHFVVSTLLFISDVMYLYLMMGKREACLMKVLNSMDMPFGLAVLAGLGIILAGGLAQYLLTLLFYKAPLDRMGQPAFLRREL